MGTIILNILIAIHIGLIAGLVVYLVFHILEPSKPNTEHPQEPTIFPSSGVSSLPRHIKPLPMNVYRPRPKLTLIQGRNNEKNN